MDDETKTTLKTLGYLSTVGLTMALSIGLGAVIGYYLDRKFGTDPWLFYVFFVFGVIAAFRNLYLMYKRSKDL
ncbi:MAG: AtpZ/AtpI family protein [Deltaproteobacteria bacterium]|nr:AtpZ/AtpI family protein [Deltaproteobacteria bacterium]